MELSDDIQYIPYPIHRMFFQNQNQFIHVHHINPISSMGSVYKINPKQDLIPVCPNCHAMIHSKKPPFSMEEIQNFRKMKSGY
jgi:5-methylcytosine-specific restriction protein A